MKLFHLAIIFPLLMATFACKHKGTGYDNNLGIQPAQVAQIDTANYTTIAFRESTKDLGTIRQGDTLQIEYPFTNDGDRPLYISSVTSGCGCTVVDYPKSMIAAGEHGTIKARLLTGTLNGFFRKSIGVVTNTRNNRMHTLVFYGDAQKPQLNK